MSGLRTILLGLWMIAGVAAVFALLLGADAPIWLSRAFPVALVTFTTAGLAWLAIAVAQHRSRYQNEPPP
jgi:hypothetical protein